MKNNDLVEVAFIIHKVKGSAGNVGACMLHGTAIVLQKALEKDQEEEKC